MSIENIEKFYALIFKNRTLAGAIKAAQAAGEENFAIIATEFGKANGFNFTVQEAVAWIEAKVAAAAKGELNDVELEAVAGGKIGPISDPGLPGAHPIWGPIIKPMPPHKNVTF